MLFFFSLTAAAMPAIPTLQSQEHVYLVPEDQAFPAGRVRQATERAERDVYVIVYDKVVDGTITSPFILRARIAI